MKKLVQIERMSKNEYYGLISELDKRKKTLFKEPEFPLHLYSKVRSENLLTPAESAIPDCLTCGFCCSLPLCVSVSRDDVTAADKYWEITMDKATEERVIDRFLKRTEINCEYLDGEIGVKVGCQIYETRPQTCHEFEAGSDRCHVYRRMSEIEKPLTETETAAFSEKLQNSERVEKIDYVMILEAEASNSLSLSRDPEVTEKKIKLEIYACVNNDPTAYLLHSYDPAEETWFESDFLGMTWPQASLKAQMPNDYLANQWLINMI